MSREVTQVILPRHVRACVEYRGQKTDNWALWLWPVEKPGTQTRVPYKCNSWRCEGECARHEAAVTFSRLRTAIMDRSLPADGWCFLVLTIDRDGYYSGKPWFDSDDAYQRLSTMSRKFLKRLRREYEHPINKWAAIVEQHRTGWPHYNLLVHCPPLAAELRAEQARKLADPELQHAVTESRRLWKEKRAVPNHLRQKAREAILIDGELMRHAVETDWGRQSSAETVRDREALAGYIIKLLGEVSKLTQRPLNAPERFRRLRTSVGLLEKRRKNPAMTGVLVRRGLQPSGEWQIVGMNASKDPYHKAAIEEAVCNEVAVIEEEEDLLSTHRGKLPPMPPVRRAVRGKLKPWTPPPPRRPPKKVAKLPLPRDG